MVVKVVAAEYAAISNKAAVNLVTTADLFILVNKLLALKEEVAVVATSIKTKVVASEVAEEVLAEEEEADLTKEVAEVEAM